MTLRVTWEQALAKGWVKADDTPRQAPQPAATRGDSTRAKRVDREGDEQAALVTRFDAGWPDLSGLLIHIPNGGSRKHRFEGWRLRRQGVRKGVSDLLLPIPSKGFHGLWIEFKAAPPFDAPVSDHQIDWLERMQEHGYATAICRGADEAMATITAYLGRSAEPPSNMVD